MTTRREFIKNTAAGTAAMTLSGLVITQMAHASILGTNDSINCAVIAVRDRFLN